MNHQHEIPCLNNLGNEEGHVLGLLVSLALISVPFGDFSRRHILTIKSKLFSHSRSGFVNSP